MNTELLKQKIEEGNGKWVAREGLEFKQDKDDGTIHCHCKRENEVGTAFLMNHNFDDFNWYMSNSFNIKEVQKSINFFQLLINVLELDVRIGVVEKEVKVEVEKIVKDDKQSGMIEAYEKLLLGKRITLE